MTDTGLLDRREFFSWTRHGLGSAALASLLLRDGVARGASVPGEASDPCPHFSRAPAVPFTFALSAP